MTVAAAMSQIDKGMVCRSSVIVRNDPYHSALGSKENAD
jgi:hypothetical protein